MIIYDFFDRIYSDKYLPFSRSLVAKNQIEMLQLSVSELWPYSTP